LPPGDSSGWMPPLRSGGPGRSSARPGVRPAVVQLQRLPGRAEVAVQVGVARGVEGMNRDPMTHDVIGMRIPSGLVIGRHHMRPKLAHHRDQPPSRHLHRRAGEAALRQTAAVGHPRVDEPEPPVCHAEYPLRLGHLPAAHPRQVGQQADIVVQIRVDDVASLTAGTRHHHDLDTFARVAGQRRPTLARFVVGMCVDGHQAQLVHPQDSILP